MKDATVAELAGITKSTFSDWKSGRSKPKTEKLIKIAAVLEVPLEAFFETRNGNA
jgi:transcriptional regulator with XRE-family HTH domain